MLREIAMKALENLNTETIVNPVSGCVFDFADADFNRIICMPKFKHAS